MHQCTKRTIMHQACTNTLSVHYCTRRALMCIVHGTVQDITENVWRGCGGNVEALLSALFHICRYDLLEHPLGLCSKHSMEQVS